jgi:hypothetical protein
VRSATPAAATAPRTGTARFAALGESTSSKQRNRIVDALLESAKRTVAAIGDDQHSFAGERGDSDTQEAPTTAAERTPPDVGDRKQECRCNRRRARREYQRSRRELVWLVDDCSGDKNSSTGIARATAQAVTAPRSQA